MSNALSRSLILYLFAASASGAIVGDRKKPYADRADDVAREHVELITTARHEYSVPMAGTVDGRMTRTPIGYGPFVQGWQPNRSVLIENTGRTDIQNPWLMVNGRGNWRTADSIVAEATRGVTTSADKARAIWEFVRRQRFHACTWDGECSDAIKALNVYGYTLCGNQAQVLDDLWRAAGLTTRRCFPIGHVVGEAFYEGRYHMMDSDEHVICLLRDNVTIASGEDIVRDHDLVKRTHTYGIGRRASRRTDEFSAALYVHDGERGGGFGQSKLHSMDYVLRPGESIEMRWDHIGKQYTSGIALREGQRRRDGLGDLLAGWGPTAYDNMRNGKIRYRPDLSLELAQRGAEDAENIVWDQAAGRIRSQRADATAQITWRFASPYVLVGGRATASVVARGDARVQWRYSTDGRQWATLAETTGEGAQGLEADLNETISPRRNPTYEFRLQLSLSGDVVASDIDFELDIQTSALGLPELTIGENRVVYADHSTGERQVRITHHWRERSARHPPDAPTTAIAPEDGGIVEGTRVRFAWGEASDPDGDAIADYHFELSAYPDMRWPLSSNFEKRISLTPNEGQSEWNIPYVGLLNPDTTYYWRVRAMDALGVWGPWSPTFQFRTRAPGVPLDLKLMPDDNGAMVLTWRPNPEGRTPVVYKVYGSDEKGFSVSDAESLVFRGRGFVRNLDEFAARSEEAPGAGVTKTPANLITPTTQTCLPVVGPHATLPNTNRAFYRVVAVDERGNESGPSDYAEVPRPFVCSQPDTPGKVGVPYQYQPQVIRSMGDLRCRRSETSSYNAAFWDREELSFQAIDLPSGLSQDPQTGVITGTPKAAGEFEIRFDVSVHTGQQATFVQRLKFSATEPLRAGAAAVDITPTELPVIICGSFRERTADRVNDRLMARALVLDDGSTRLALVVVDTLMMARDLIDEVKQAAEQATGIPVDRMMISATHTHSGPSAMACLGSRADPQYRPWLPAQITKAIVLANERLAPARGGWGVIQDFKHNHCRRWVFRPDRVQTDPFGGRTVRAHMHPGYQSPNHVGPAGPADPDFSMLAIQTRDGRPLAVLANYAMHYYGSAPVSGDVCGRFGDVLAARIGAAEGDPPFIGMMSQGTSGDSMWMDYSQPAPQRDLEAYTEALVATAQEVYAQIEYRDTVTLDMAETTLRLRRRVPDETRLTWARDIVQGLGESLPREMAEVYACEQVYLHEQPEVELKLQAIRVGELGITAIPNEVYGITGLKLKASSPLQPTFNIELANGAQGYIPPPEQHHLGGYTTWPARTAGLEVQAEPQIVATLLELLEKVSDKPRRDVGDDTAEYSAKVLRSKPVAFWRFSELAGATARDASARHDGMYEDGVAFFLPGPPGEKFSTASRGNRAAHFAGGRMHARIQGLARAYSVEFWFWNGLPHDARPVTAYLFSRGVDAAPDAPGDHLGIGGTHQEGLIGRLIFFNGNRLGDILAGSTELETKTWYHVALTRDGERVRAYLNGKLELSGDIQIGCPDDVDQLFFGGRSDKLFNLEGKLDEAAVYDRVLAPDEIAAHYDAAK